MAEHDPGANKGSHRRASLPARLALVPRERAFQDWWLTSSPWVLISFLCFLAKVVYFGESGLFIFFAKVFIFLQKELIEKKQRHHSQRYEQGGDL